MAANTGDREPDFAIRAEGLVKRFGSVNAVDGIDFAVPRGTVLGMLGPNGAGKTTVVRILTTILRPDAGRATILGLDVARHAQAVRSIIGLAGQYAAVDPNLTGRENLRLVGMLTHQPTRTARARADELLERFDLADAADRKAATYSGGMRRRVDLAAALVHRPPVLFLDEPTTGLDPRSRTQLWDVIGELVTEGTTVLLTTQYLEEADRLADDLLVIDGGKVVAQGSTEQLKRRMGTTVAEITFADHAGAVQAAATLGRIGQVTVAEQAAVLGITLPDSGVTLLAALQLLGTAGPTPVSVAVHSPTLDDVFLRLTGQDKELAP